ncbi:MAG: hypothetical protein NW207_08955 [Cytophagales bacterium]|nr:hypothetical protein [Cytophagales bacterium]
MALTYSITSAWLACEEHLQGRTLNTYAFISLYPEKTSSTFKFNVTLKVGYPRAINNITYDVFYYQIYRYNNFGEITKSDKPPEQLPLLYFLIIINLPFGIKI